jgi:hypothetical protein
MRRSDHEIIRDILKCIAKKAPKPKEEFVDEPVPHKKAIYVPPPESLVRKLIEDLRAKRPPAMGNAARNRERTRDARKKLVAARKALARVPYFSDPNFWSKYFWQDTAVAIPEPPKPPITETVPSRLAWLDERIAECDRLLALKPKDWIRLKLGEYGNTHLHKQAAIAACTLLELVVVKKPYSRSSFSPLYKITKWLLEAVDGKRHDPMRAVEAVSKDRRARARSLVKGT